MKKILLITILHLFYSLSFGQQQPLYSQYMLNDFLLNPAIVGTTETAPIRMTIRQQWVGIENAPSTQALSGHTSLLNLENCGVGGLIYHDKFGPSSQTGVNGSFAYRIQVGTETNLSFGMSLSAFQYKIDEKGLNIINPDDPAITGKLETKWAPDANFGLYLYHSRYNFGFSSTQLIQYSLFKNDINNGKMVRHYYLTGGYSLPLGEDYELLPSILLKTTEQSPVQLDVNAQILYMKTFWMAFSYRHNDASVAMIGFKKDRFQFGYAFDYTLSHLSNYTHGSHEVMIGFDITQKTDKAFFK